jgi:hypothetical protein
VRRRSAEGAEQGKGEDREQRAQWRIWAHAAVIIVPPISVPRPGRLPADDDGVVG